MHRTRVSPNKGSSAMLFGAEIQGGFQNAQCSEAAKPSQMPIQDMSTEMTT